MSIKRIWSMTHRTGRRESDGRDVVLANEASNETPSNACFKLLFRRKQLCAVWAGVIAIKKAVSTLNPAGASSSCLRSFTSQAEPLSNTEALNQPFSSLFHPSIHPPTPASNTRAYPRTLPGSATIPPGSTNLPALLSIVYIALLSQSNPCSTASTASNRHVASNILPESPH